LNSLFGKESNVASPTFTNRWLMVIPAFTTQMYVYCIDRQMYKYMYTCQQTYNKFISKAVYVYRCIYILVYIYIYAYIHVHKYVFLCIHEYVCVSI
jgi:hypothetical protein